MKAETSMYEYNNSVEDGSVPALPRKRFGPADCDTINTIHLFLCTQSADLHHLREGR